MLNRALKLCAFFLICSAFLIECWFSEFLWKLSTLWNLAPNQKSRIHQKRAARIARYSDQLLKSLQIQTRILNLPESLSAGLIVCNHLSYIDVLVLSRVVPSLFITSVEVKQSFGLGTITRLAGCLFVERRSRTHLHAETREIKEALVSGTPVVLFPEGTSTQGDHVLPFRAALFESAISAKVPVHSFYLHYSHSEVPYYGDHEFMGHLFRLCGIGPIKAELRYLSEAASDQGDRKWLAGTTYANVIQAHVSRV